MTDTRPHFYFNEFGEVTGENLDPSFMYVLLYLSSENLPCWKVYDYINYTASSNSGNPNGVKIYAIPTEDFRASDIYQEEDELVARFPSAKYIGLLEYPNGELYEQEDDSSWEIAGKTVKSLHIGNKEIQSIKRISDGIILYYKTSSIIPDDINITATKDVLSSYHGESSVLTATVVDANNQPCSGETVVFKIGNIILSTQTTDSNGEVSYTYQSAGAGDVSIKIECRSLEKTFAITDAWKYISSGSYTGTSSISFQELYESSVYDNIEISATIKAPNKGFSLAFLKSKDSSSSIQDNIFTIGVDAANYIAVTRIENGKVITYNSSSAQQYTANSDLNCVIRIENGVVTLKLNNHSYTSTPITGLKYVGVRNWNNAKTVTYTDFIVKPL